MNSRIIISILASLLSSFAFAQPKSLDTYFKQVKADKHPAIPQEITNPENAAAVLKALPVYYKDTTALVRSKAYSLAKSIGTKSQDKSIRQQAVQQLLEGGKDVHTGNAGSALKYLTLFKQQDFVAASKDSLRSQFRRSPRHVDVKVKLIGFLEMKELRDEVYSLSQQSTLGRKERWSTSLALARMGDAQATTDIVNRIERMPESDALIYEIYPDLVYTRTQEAMELLLVTLNSDAKNCSAADAERDAKIPCAYRVMEMLAPVLENYPLTVDESGDIRTNDYPEALRIAREWCSTQKTFTIRKDTF